MMQITIDAVSTSLFLLVSNPVLPVATGGAAFSNYLVRNTARARMWFRCALASAAFAGVAYAAGGGAFPTPCLCGDNPLHGGPELFSASLLAVLSYLALATAFGLRSRRLSLCAAAMACAACFTILRLNQ